MSGIFYGIGVGPGDPELMTLKAVKRIRSCQVIAIPHSDRGACAAYQIAVQAVPELREKECLCLPMPMTKDREALRKSHEEAARSAISALDKGKDVGFLTLGDPTVYSTCLYLEARLRAQGRKTELINGVPSFCAAAARLGIPLVNGQEELHVIPATYQVEEGLKWPGVKVFMKAGRTMEKLKASLENQGRQVYMVEKCGMAGEAVYRGAKEIPGNPSYYSLLIVRDEAEGPGSGK